MWPRQLSCFPKSSQVTQYSQAALGWQATPTNWTYMLRLGWFTVLGEYWLALGLHPIGTHSDSCTLTFHDLKQVNKQQEVPGNDISYIRIMWWTMIISTYCIGAHICRHQDLQTSAHTFTPTANIQFLCSTVHGSQLILPFSSGLCLCGPILPPQTHTKTFTSLVKKTKYNLLTLWHNLHITAGQTPSAHLTDGQTTAHSSLLLLFSTSTYTQHDISWYSSWLHATVFTIIL